MSSLLDRREFQFDTPSYEGGTPSYARPTLSSAVGSRGAPGESSRGFRIPTGLSSAGRDSIGLSATREYTNRLAATNEFANTYFNTQRQIAASEAALRNQPARGGSTRRPSTFGKVTGTIGNIAGVASLIPGAAPIAAPIAAGAKILGGLFG